jgi:hypothetical protein
VNLDNVSRDDWLIGGLAILLIIDLLALAWFSVGGGSVAGVTIPSFDFTATDAPDGWLGVLAVLALLALLIDLAIERFSPSTQLPAIGGSRASTRAILAAAAAGFLLLKFLFHINHFSDLAIGFWIAVVLTAALLYFALQARAGRPITAAGLGGSRRSPTRGGGTPPPSTPGAGTPGAGTPGTSAPGGGTAPGGTPPPASPGPGSAPPSGGSAPPPSSPPPGV